MNTLVTTSRMPVAIDLIRKLGRSGHRVIATDTFSTAPGSHSKYVSEAIVTASPRHDTERFIQQISDVVARHRIDMIVPAFEEVFYLARHRDRFDPEACFFPDLPTLLALHDKGSLQDLAKTLGIRVPESDVVRSSEELRERVARRDRFFAKPVYSRGGVDLFTNTGPLAGALSIEECLPTPSEPWIVQDFVSGLDVCTFSVVQHGRIAAHSTYVHPREIEHAGGIVFESVVEPEALEIAQRIAAATGYHGHLSLDLMKTDEGMVLIECNPRPTAGAHVMSTAMWQAAIFEPLPRRPRVAPAGARKKYSIALVRDAVLHFREAREDLRYLFSRSKDAIAERDDWMPALYQVLSYGHVIRYRRSLARRAHKNTELMAAYFADVCFNGDDRAALARGGHSEPAGETECSTITPTTTTTSTSPSSTTRTAASAPSSRSTARRRSGSPAVDAASGATPTIDKL